MKRFLLGLILTTLLICGSVQHPQAAKVPCEQLMFDPKLWGDELWAALKANGCECK